MQVVVVGAFSIWRSATIVGVFRELRRSREQAIVGNLFQLEGVLTRAERRRAGVVIGLFVAFVVALVVFPHTPVDGTVLCPFRRLTGFSCPGCGMTRACILLAHGELRASLTMHPFGWLVVLGFFAVAARNTIEAAFGRRWKYPGKAYWKRANNPVLMGCLISVVVFGAVRLVLELSGFLTPV